MKEPQTLDFDYNGKSYSIGFNRKVCKQMERQRFNPANVTNAPVSTIIEFFRWSFVMNHRQKVDLSMAEEIYNHMTEKDLLIDTLIDMYNACVNTLFEEPDDNDEKKITWKKVTD